MSPVHIRPIGPVYTETLRAPAVRVVLANAGLEVGASVDGLKITERKM